LDNRAAHPEPAVGEARGPREVLEARGVACVSADLPAVATRGRYALLVKGILRNLEPFATPDALNPILARLPAIRSQQCGDTAAAAAPALGCQSDDGRGQRVLFGRHGGQIASRAAVLVDGPAGVAFRETVPLPDVCNRLAASFGCYEAPAATSANICFFKVRSATSRRSRAFSRSGSFIFRA
jgi:hypothetical protein